jgi:GTPase
VLCYVLDLSEEDPANALAVLRAELGAYDPALAARPAVVVGNKLDLPAARDRAAAARNAAAPHPFLALSALTGEGVDELSPALARAVGEARDARPLEDEPAVLRIRPDAVKVEVSRENGAYRVHDPRAEGLVARFDLTNPDAVRYVQERLVGLGVEDALQRAGAKAGDEVRIGAEAFEFIPERDA